MDFEVTNKERWDDGAERGITYTISYYDNGYHYTFYVYGYGGDTEFDCVDWENSVSPGISFERCLDAISSGIYYAPQSHVDVS